jgi:hypothetical protein
LPDCEANIARLALFAQQTGGAAAPSAAPPGTPMRAISYTDKYFYKLFLQKSKLNFLRFLKTRRQFQVKD